MENTATGTAPISPLRQIHGLAAFSAAIASAYSPPPGEAGNDAAEATCSLISNIGTRIAGVAERIEPLAGEDQDIVATQLIRYFSPVHSLLFLALQNEAPVDAIRDLQHYAAELQRDLIAAEKRVRTRIDIELEEQLKALPPAAEPLSQLEYERRLAEVRERLKDEPNALYVEELILDNLRHPLGARNREMLRTATIMNAQVALAAVGVQHQLSSYHLTLEDVITGRVDRVKQKYRFYKLAGDVIGKAAIHYVAPAGQELPLQLLEMIALKWYFEPAIDQRQTSALSIATYTTILAFTLGIILPATCILGDLLIREHSRQGFDGDDS